MLFRSPRAVHLAAGAEPDGLLGISDARIVDHFLFFVEELGVMEALRGLRPEGVRREVIPAELFIVLYFLRCLARIPSQESLPDLLFSDTALMLRLGFNAHQVELGITKRGGSRRKGARRNVPVDPEAISKNVGRLDLEAVRAFVHLVLAAVWAKQPVVSAKGLFVIDGSFVEPGESTPGAGVTSRSTSVRTTDGVKTVNEVTVGFKMVWMWSVETGLPVTVAFGTAAAADGEGDGDPRPVRPGGVRTDAGLPRVARRPGSRGGCREVRDARRACASHRGRKPGQAPGFCRRRVWDFLLQ